ncbi:MAG: hypothetical protein ACRDYZ_09595 [Acidimicrobiales bacterium]
MPNIPPVATLRCDETFGETGLASRARHAARRVIVAAHEAIGTAVRSLSSATRGESPSSSRVLRIPVPAPVPVPVPLHTARRRARLAGHPAGRCCQW